MSTLTNATSGKEAERLRNFGWNRTHGAHHVAVMFTHARGETASASRSAAASTAVEGAEAVEPIWSEDLAPRLRRPCSVRTSHPKAPDEDAEPASPNGRRGAVTTPDAGAAHQGAGVGASSAMSRATKTAVPTCLEESQVTDRKSRASSEVTGRQRPRQQRTTHAHVRVDAVPNSRRAAQVARDSPSTPPPRLAMSSPALASSTSSVLAGARRGLVPDEPRASRRRAARVAVVVRASSASEERRKAAECTRRGLLSSGTLRVPRRDDASTIPTFSPPFGRRSTVPSPSTASAPPPRR